VVNPTLANYAETLYVNDLNALPMAKKRKLPDGKSVDYVLVYQTPPVV
jgi:hypothetical protein